MTKQENLSRPLLLAVYPTARGYAYVLFEGPLAPFDWAVRRVKRSRRNVTILDQVAGLLDRYNPDTLVFEALTPSGPQRSAGVYSLYLALGHLARARSIEISRYERKAVRQCFASAGAHTKPEIAQAIASMIPAFKHRLPPVRKLWASEDDRQSLFDAAALALTHYATAEAPRDS